jgi:hypothetical protein
MSHVVSLKFSSVGTGSRREMSRARSIGKHMLAQSGSKQASQREVATVDPLVLRKTWFLIEFDCSGPRIFVRSIQCVG